MCCAVFVVSQTFGLGASSDQVHYESEEGEGGWQQRIWVKKLYCQIESGISETKKIERFVILGLFYSLFLLPLGIQIVINLLVSYRHHHNQNPEKNNADQELVDDPHGNLG